jgi:WD repeat-containing protein 19
MDLYKSLKERNLPVSNELNHRLAVLHSYILAKKYIVSKLHMKAARNLLRVANNINMFEKDIVNILTTVVIECAEVGLNKSASQYALVLMNEKYKNSIKDAYRSKIDKISIKAYKNEDEEIQTSSPCPFCSENVPDYNLNCDKCMNILPFCIGSGRHIIINDMVTCPHCLFPCIQKEMNELLNNDRLCPMCDCEIEITMLNKVILILLNL